MFIFFEIMNILISALCKEYTVLNYVFRNFHLNNQNSRELPEAGFAFTDW